jgi:hypothetical protein
MPNLDVPVAAHLLTGSILTLVMPIAVVILITIWYVALWRGGTGER